MDILLTAEVNKQPCRIGWISLQPDGSVSVGLNDRAFVSPDFKAQNFVWSVYNRETIQYLVQSDPATLRPVPQPHLNFHPPHWFHLRGNGGKKLFEGIGDLPLMLRQDGIVPWIRFVSKRVAKLPGAGLPRNPERTRTIAIPLSTADCSVGLAVDFLRADLDPPHAEELLVSEAIEWRGYKLLVSAVTPASQIATLSWFHQR
jgi:hypothetical protein